MKARIEKTGLLFDGSRPHSWETPDRYEFRLDAEVGGQRFGARHVVERYQLEALGPDFEAHVKSSLFRQLGNYIAQELEAIADHD